MRPRSGNAASKRHAHNRPHPPGISNYAFQTSPQIRCFAQPKRPDSAGSSRKSAFPNTQSKSNSPRNKALFVSNQPKTGHGGAFSSSKKAVRNERSADSYTMKHKSSTQSTSQTRYTMQVTNSRSNTSASSNQRLADRNLALRKELQRLQRYRTRSDHVQAGPASARQASSSEKNYYNRRPGSAGAVSTSHRGASASNRPHSSSESDPSPSPSVNAYSGAANAAGDEQLIQAGKHRSNVVKVPGGRAVPRSDLSSGMSKPMITLETNHSRSSSKQAMHHGNSNSRSRTSSSSSSSLSGSAPSSGRTSASGVYGAKHNSNAPAATSTVQEQLRLQKLIASGSLLKGKSTTEFYAFGKVLGVGSFGKVRLAWHKLTGQRVAIKTYEKSKTKDQAQWKRVQQEVRLMERLNHVHCIRLFEAIETPKRVHIIMEHAGGGSLCSYVKLRKRLHEDEARHIFVQLLSSLDYMHSLNIIHRDIKLENVLLDNFRNMKLVDFGFSVYVRDKKLRIFCGTPSYMAPEIVQRREYFGKPVDLWSLGVLLYACLCGCFPFTARNYPDLYKRIVRGHFRFPEFLSRSVCDLLRAILVVDPNRRYTMSQIRSHPWVRAYQPPTRVRHSTAHLISNDPADDLDETVLAKMQEVGIPRDVVIKSVLDKQHNCITTTHYLLLKKLSESSNSSHVADSRTTSNTQIKRNADHNQHTVPTASKYQLTSQSSGQAQWATPTQAVKAVAPSATSTTNSTKGSKSSSSQNQVAFHSIQRISTTNMNGPPPAYKHVSNTPASQPQQLRVGVSQLKQMKVDPVVNFDGVGELMDDLAPKVYT